MSSANPLAEPLTGNNVDEIAVHDPPIACRPITPKPGVCSVANLAKGSLVLLFSPVLVVGVVLYLVFVLLTLPCAPKRLPHLIRDIGFLRALLFTKGYIDDLNARSDNKWTTADFFAEAVEAHRSREFIKYVNDGSSYTYGEADELMNKAANGLFKRLDLKAGDCVGLLMTNRPEFLFVSYGLQKLGVACAMLNPSVGGKGLHHSCKITGATAVVFGFEHIEAATELYKYRKSVDQEAEGLVPMHFILVTDGRNKASASPAAAQFQSLGDAHGVNVGLSGDDFVMHIPNEDGSQIDYRRRDAIEGVQEQTTMTSTAMHIYTSGTTGLPKAARIHHIKIIGSGVAMPTFYLKRSEYTKQRFYISMPLFHSAAMLVGIASCVYMGGTVVLRDKFSRSNFWKDCKEHNVTTIQYIGELLRYLVNAPPGTDDKAHSVKLALGNGLRPDVWAAFQQRFGVPRIGEFYASTEGNATLLNNQNKFGAVGFISPLVATKYPVKLARYDVATDALVRDPETGLCIECPANEKGELLGQIISDDVTRRFDGYSNKEATEKKIVRNVFRQGDAYFRSGDLLKRDADGFVYFVDRIGDTFRWKGENVSTTEVEECFEAGASGDGRFGITEVSVYGAAIDGCDGRAGMAAVVLGEKTGGELDLVALRAHLKEQLPSYAAPLFVRILTGGMEVTATFKNRKVTLKEEGMAAYDKDPVYFRDESVGAFVRVDKELYDKINAGQCKL